MIAKHIPINSVSKSSFSGLVNYILDTKNKTERIGIVRSVNCYSDRADCVIAEVLNTQQMNQRATSDKTYHLMVSFRDDALSETVLKAVEDKLCDGLGFGEHQRISAVHHDTDHLHIHIAINKIHPTSLTIHNPHYDYKVIGELCKKLEQEYGLTPDNHETKKHGAQGRASNIEFKAGSESLIGWMQQECLGSIQSAISWAQLHQVLADHGLALHERGNGFVFVSGNGVGVKASSVDRSLSKANLVKKLGVFVKNGSDNNKNTNTKNSHSKHYEKKPLRSRLDTTNLYAQYKVEQNAAAVHGKNEWIKLRNKKDQAIESAKEKAKLKRLLIKSVTAGKLAKKLMVASVYQEFKASIESIKKDYKKSYQTSKTKHRRLDWLSWLVKESNLGNKEALDVLRSRKDYQSTVNNISGAQDKEIDGFVTHHEMIETITRTGTIIFHMGSTAIRDGGKGFVVITGTAKDKIRDVLTAAMKKYGNTLTINGSDSFRGQVVQVAAETNLDVIFDDEALEKRKRDLIDQGTRQNLLRGDRGLVKEDNAAQQKIPKEGINPTRKGRSR